MTLALGIAVVACTLVCLAALVRLHAVDRDVRPLRDAVSAYGIGPHRAGYAVAAVSIGLAGIAAALAFAHAVPEVRNRAIALLIVFAVARIAIPAFPMDTRVAAHALLAFAAFATFCWAAVSVGADVRWRIGPALEALGWAAAAGVVLTGLAARRVPALGPYLGLAERGFYAAMLAWFGLVGLQLARLG